MLLPISNITLPTMETTIPLSTELAFPTLDLRLDHLSSSSSVISTDPTKSDGMESAQLPEWMMERTTASRSKSMDLPFTKKSSPQSTDKHLPPQLLTPRSSLTPSVEEHITEFIKSSRESISTQLLPMLSSLSLSLEAEPSIKASSPMLLFPNTSRLMIPALDAVLLAAPLTLVLIPPLDHPPVLLAILKPDSSSTPMREDAPVFLDSILIPPRPSNAINALPFTAQSAMPPDPSNASPALLEPLLESETPAPVELDTSSMELPANNVPTNAKPAAHPTEPALHVSTPSAETSLKTVNALLDSLIPEPSTALLATLPVKPAPMDHHALHAQLLPSETSPLPVCAHA